MEKKVSFPAACEIEKKIAREENWLLRRMRMRGWCEDGGVEHSKEQELESRMICHKFCMRYLKSSYMLS